METVVHLTLPYVIPLAPDPLCALLPFIYNPELTEQ